MNKQNITIFIQDTPSIFKDNLSQSKLKQLISENKKHNINIIPFGLSLYHKNTEYINNNHYQISGQNDYPYKLNNFYYLNETNNSFF